MRKKIISSIRKEISKEVKEIIRASSETSENNALNSTVDDIETYIIDKHQQNLISKLKEEIFNEIKPLMKNSIKKHSEGEIIASLKEHNNRLISNLYFLREEMKQKNMIINTLITKYDSVKTDYHHSPYNANGNPFNPFTDHIPSETDSETSNKVNHNIELPNTVFENNMNINDKHVTKNRRKLKQLNVEQELISSAKPCNDNTNNEISIKEQSEAYNENSKNHSKTNKKTKKKLLIIGDSIVKHVEGWRLQKRMKSSVSVRSIYGGTTKSMVYHVKGCLEDMTPDSIIIHHGANDLNNKKVTAEVIGEKIINLAVSVKKNVENVISGLTVRNDKWNEKGINVNDYIKNNCEKHNLEFIDNSNVSLNMLNSSGLHLNEYGTTRLVNNFCHKVNK